MKPLLEEVMFHGVVKYNFCNRHKVCGTHLHNSLLANKIASLNIYHFKQCDQELLLECLYREVFPLPVLGNITSTKQQWRGRGEGGIEDFLKFPFFCSICFHYPVPCRFLSGNSMYVEKIAFQSTVDFCLQHSCIWIFISYAEKKEEETTTTTKVKHIHLEKSNLAVTSLAGPTMRVVLILCTSGHLTVKCHTTVRPLLSSPVWRETDTCSDDSLYLHQGLRQGE